MVNLPPEILCKIFLQCLPMTPILNLEVRKKGRPGESVLVPLRISHVCRLWRELALSSSELWSCLCIMYYGQGSRLGWPGRRKVMLEVFDTWFQRTGQSALSFAFCCNIIWDETDSRACEYIITTLLSQQHRWKDVYFDWQGLTVPPDFPAFNLTDMPLLTSLYFSAMDFQAQSGGFMQVYTRIDISQSRRLKHLQAYSVHALEVGEEPFSDLTGPVAIHFADDKTGRTIGVQASMCRQLLTASPNIEHLSVLTWRSEDSIVSSSAMNALNLRNLKTLRLVTGSFAANVLKGLTLPRLESLEYEDNGISSGGEIFLDFARRSMPPLLYLHLSGSHAEDGTLIPALRLFPELEELRVTYENLSSQIFEALTVDSSADRSGNHSTTIANNLLCPALQCLHLYTMSFTVPDFSPALLSMVTSRWTAFGTLFRILGDETNFSLTMPLSQEERESFGAHVTKASRIDVLSYYTSDEEYDRMTRLHARGPCRPEARGRLYPFELD